MNIFSNFIENIQEINELYTKFSFTKFIENHHIDYYYLLFQLFKSNREFLLFNL